MELMESMVLRPLSSLEKITLAIIKAQPGILGRELDKALLVKPRERYAAIEKLRDNLFPIIGEKSGIEGYGYRLAQSKEEWEQYAAREVKECHRRLKRVAAIQKAGLWRDK